MFHTMESLLSLHRCLPSDSRISGQHDGWPVLVVHPNPSAPLNITCDASDFAVGGVLQQCIDNVWQPLLFFIKKLAPAETRYSAFDRELLVVYATIRHFRHNLERREFFVNADHKPLTSVMNSTTQCSSLRQTRDLAFIAEFTTDIRYVKEETHFVAHALSRPTVSAIECDAVIKSDQALDTEFIRLRHSTSSTVELRLLKTIDDVLVWCDVSTGHTRPYVTKKIHRKVFLQHFTV